MTILGVDPGPEETSLVVWESPPGVLRYSSSIPSKDVCALLGTLCVDVVACEHMQCLGMSVGKEVFESCYWIGEYRYRCRDLGLRFYRVYRMDEKMALCGSARAKDSNIRQSLIDRYGVVGTAKNPGPLYGIANDRWSALAVAVTAEAALATEALGAKH